MRRPAFHLCVVLATLALLPVSATATNIDSILPEPTYGNPQEDFSMAVPAVTFSTAYRIRLSVIEDREYVKSGEYGRDYVGMQRGKAGIPAKTITASSGSLAKELEQAISKGLSKAGIANYVPDPRLTYTDSENDLSLVITLTDWYTDIYQKGVGFSHNATIAVFDLSGNKLASEFIEGFENHTAQIDAFRNALSLLLAKQTIVTALTQPDTLKNFKASRTPDAPASPGNAKVRLTQLKDMLDSGLITAKEYEAKKAEILKAM
jgi:hypothetical protein